MTSGWKERNWLILTSAAAAIIGQRLLRLTMIHFSPVEIIVRTVSSALFGCLTGEKSDRTEVVQWHLLAMINLYGRAELKFARVGMCA